MGEVGADGCGWDGDAWGPFGDELLDVGEPCVATGVEVEDNLFRADAVGRESGGANGPDGGDPGKASELAPERREVEPEQAGVGGVDGGTGFACEQRGIADEQGCVVGGEHGEWVCGLLDEGGMRVMEVLEEDVCVGGGAAGFLMSRRMLRTSCSEAMVQPGTMASSGVRAAMGMRPRSAEPSCNCCAQAEGSVYASL